MNSGLKVLILWSLLLGPAWVLAQEAAPALVDAPGKDVVIAICGECHDAAPKITKLRKTRAQWTDVIGDMQTRGLMADDKDLEMVLSYLATNYGPQPDQSEKK